MNLRSVIDEIRERLDLRQIIPDVKRMGASYYAVCPFHTDSNPSLSVHQTFYNCFGCGESGDVLDWFMSPAGGGMDFNQALMQASIEARVDLDNEWQAEVHKLQEERDKRVEQLEFYQSKLEDSEAAQAYLRDRGLNTETIKHFGLGYNPHENAIAIPVFSKTKKLEAITLRYLEARGNMKYRHETGWAKKGIFYNSQELEFGDGPVYVCEGMFDVMSLWQCGFTRSVAILGSGLADEHIKQINGAAIVFVPDRVKEGDWELFRKAVFRARRAYPNQVIRAAILPMGHDASSAGETALREAVANAQYAEKAILDAELADCGSDVDAEHKAARRIVSVINDGLTRAELVKDLSRRWDIDRETVKLELSRSDGEISRVKTVTEVLLELEEREQRTAMDGVGLNGLGLDRYVERPHTSQLAIIAARTNVGKTVIALNVLYNCHKQQVPTLFVSQEQPASELVFRLALMLSSDTPQHVNSKTLRYNILHETDWWKHHKTSLVDNFPHIRFEERILTPEGVKAAVQDASYSLGEAVKVLFVDYIGLLKPNNKTNDAYERVSSIMRDMQAVTKETDVFGIYLMQLSREGKDGTEKVTLNMLRDSGVSEETADYIIGAWRDKDEETYRDAGVAKLHLNVCKNRHGQRGEAELFMNLDTLRLHQVEYHHGVVDEDGVVGDSEKSSVDQIWS